MAYDNQDSYDVEDNLRDFQHTCCVKLFELWNPQYPNDFDAFD